MKPDNIFHTVFATSTDANKGDSTAKIRNPKGAGRKKQEPTDVLYRRISVIKKDRITEIVDAAVSNDEVLMALEWVLAQYKARNPQ